MEVRLWELSPQIQEPGFPQLGRNLYLMSVMITKWALNLKQGDKI